MELKRDENKNMSGGIEVRLKKRDYSGYLFVGPAMCFILAFAIIPIGMTIYYSMTKFDIINPPVFTGLANYKRLLADLSVRTAIKNTLLYTVIAVPLQTIFAVILASMIALHRPNRFAGFVKSAMFVPVISSMILVGSIWGIMFTAQNGLINAFLNWFHIPSVNWLGSSKTAMISICIVGIWKNVGYFMVIYIAAINNISRSLYEAAKIDGATPLQSFLHITLPLIRPYTFMVVILGTIWSFQMFDLAYTMTGGGPGQATMTLVYLVYNTAYRNCEMGYACSIAMLLFAIVVVISIIQRKLLGKSKED